MFGPKGPMLQNESTELFGRKLGHPLVDVSVEAFFGVLALEEQLLQLPLDSERLREWHFPTRDDSALDVPNRFGCLVRGCELLGVGEHFSQEGGAIAFVDFVHQTNLLRFLAGKRSPSDHKLDGFCWARQPRHALGPAGSRQHAKCDLGQADLACIASREANVAGHCDLQSAAHSMPVERCDHKLWGLLKTR